MELFLLLRSFVFGELVNIFLFKFYSLQPTMRFISYQWCLTVFKQVRSRGGFKRIYEGKRNEIP